MSDWITVREYATRFDAELAKARLESAEIPATIIAHEAGAFGPGFQGVVPSGVELRVPVAALGDARAVLNDEAEAES